MVGDAAGTLACRVIEQRTVPDRSRDPRDASIHGGVIGPGGEAGDTKADVDPSTQPVSSALSPWRWHCFDVGTTAWLPGDLLSLWIRIDEVRPFPPSPLTSGASPAEAAAPAGGRRSRGYLPLGYRPLVRSFELRAVDDARAEEIARGGCCAPFRDRHQRLLASSGSTRVSGGSATADASAARLGDECYYAPAFGSAASGPGNGVAAVVQLDLAAVCPMNMAAAGGTWA